MKIKLCRKCGLKKSVDQFYRRKIGTRVGEYYEKCIDCMKARGIAYYHQNHARQLKLAQIRRQKAYTIKRDFISKSKNKACIDCGQAYPAYVMNFDHRDPRCKIKDVTRLVSRNWSLEKIKSEIEKCDVVCANCHRIRTYRNARVAKVVTAGL